MSGYNFNEIKHESFKDERVCDWSFIEVEGHDARVYYKPNKKKGWGFSFFAVENVGGVCTPEYEKDHWHVEDCYVDCLFHGTALFDGVRHLYMGDEQTANFGYHYYPNIKTMAATLEVLNQLVDEYCLVN